MTRPEWIEDGFGAIYSASRSDHPPAERPDQARTDADLTRMRTLSTAELQTALSFLHGRLDGNETTRAAWIRALDYATEAK